MHILACTVTIPRSWKSLTILCISATILFHLGNFEPILTFGLCYMRIKLQNYWGPF